MPNKVILVSVDGMRPDGFLECGNPFINELMSRSTYTLKGKTVLPSVTLPCHMSMFHSVPPERHGILSNIYSPLVRPLDGIMERVKAAQKNAAMFYGWEPLRDISRPGSLVYAKYAKAMEFDNTDKILTDDAIPFIRQYQPDFVFLYLVDTDERGGHAYGWMSKEYLDIISNAMDQIKAVTEAFPDYTVIVTADHGGHNRSHGSDCPEDTTIPMFFMGEEFEAGKEIEGITILDIAPTIADVMNILPAPEWEGKSLIKKD